MSTDFHIHCDLHGVAGPQLWRKAGGILFAPVHPMHGGEYPADNRQFAYDAQFDWCRFLIDHEFCGEYLQIRRIG